MAIFDERVLEPFVDRGLGTSGVASREIQASNLPSLSAAIRTSSATMENDAAQRNYENKVKSSINLRSTFGQNVGGSGSSGYDPRKATAAFISTPLEPGASAFAPRYGISYSTNNGQHETKKFINFKEAADFVKTLQRRGIQVASPGVQMGLSNQEALRLKELGVFNLSDPTLLENISGVSVRAGMFGGKPLIRGTGADPVKLSRLASLPITPEQEVIKHNATASRKFI